MRPGLHGSKTKREGLGCGGGGCTSLKCQQVVCVHSQWAQISSKQPGTVSALIIIIISATDLGIHSKHYEFLRNLGLRTTCSYRSTFLVFIKSAGIMRCHEILCGSANWPCTRTYLYSAIPS